MSGNIVNVLGCSGCVTDVVLHLGIDIDNLGVLVWGLMTPVRKVQP